MISSKAASFGHFSALRFGLWALCAAALLAGCGGAIGSEGAEGETEDAAAAITVNDIMARANDYLTHDIVYCGGPKGQLDETGCGEGICNQPTGPWDGYRSDCSGFVSYVWQIAWDPTSAVYNRDRAGAGGWTTVATDSLRAGDALVTDGHIKLFSAFSGSSAALIYEEYDCNRIAHKEVQHFTRSGSHIYFDGDGRPYHGIRRNGLSNPTPAAPVHVTCGLNAGQALHPGDKVMACGNKGELTLQSDGNLVFRSTTHSAALWATHTQNERVTQAIMQTDGNLVVYAGSHAVWDSKTAGHSGSALKVQADGNLVIYGPGNAVLWQSHSAYPQEVSCGLNRGQTLGAGHSVSSCDGRFDLAMQTDGNLVVYEKGHPLWASNTVHQGGSRVVMQTDGNLVIYGSHGAVWASNTAGHPGSALALQSDGNAVIYAPGGHPIWATNSSGN